MDENAKETADSASQTSHNFEEEIKGLCRSIVNLEKINDEMRNYVKKCVEE